MTEDSEAGGPQAFENLSADEPKRIAKWYQEIADPRRGQPLSNRVGSRRFRRRMVVGTYGGWLLIAAIVKVWSVTSGGWFVSMCVLGIANATIQLVWLWRRTYINAPQLAESELDERLVQISNQAFRTAYRVLVPVAFIAWGLSSTVLEWQPNDQGKVDAFVIFFGAALLATTLPTTILAWREPDPAEPEQPPA
ncbi:MAG TPA: hypothetical protein VIJ58_06100 [Candidatus Dormibacteraeota bacterium]